MNLLIMKFSPTSCHFTPLRSKYSPQHPVTKAEEYPLLGAVTKQLLVKTLRAGKDIAGTVVFCEVWRLAVAL
jgi:hypothetical protein